MPKDTYLNMISIIGAGPAGNYLAYLLSSAGKEVCVFEEHEQIGLPIQCTGIVSNSFRELMPIDKPYVVNTSEYTRVYSPDGKHIDLKLKKEFILDRHLFDKYLAEKAKASGTRYYLAHKLAGFKKTKNGFRLSLIKKGKKISMHTKRLVGADGPASSVAKCAGFLKKRKYFCGIQARAKYKNNNLIEFYPYLGSFAWIVPENKNTARIGLCSYTRSKKLFDSFLKKKGIEEILEMQGGTIPLHDPLQKTCSGNLYLLGDAATQVKATTGGGILQSLYAARSLSKAILENRHYDLLWRTDQGMSLFSHLLLRRMMDRFKDEEWDELLFRCRSKKIRKILHEKSRDSPVSLLFSLLTADPAMLSYLRYLF